MQMLQRYRSVTDMRLGSIRADDLYQGMSATIRGPTMTTSHDRGPLTGRLLTVAEVAEVLRVSNMTVYRLIKAGELPALRVGKNYRIRESELEAFLSAGLIDSEGVSS